MRNKITHAARTELANAIRRRYQSATGRQKRKILDEFVATTGYHEKSAIRVLNGQPTAEHRQTRKRPSIYDEAARGALVVLWEASDRVCGKRLKALLPILLPALERHGHLKLDETIRTKILAMSAATIDRLLRAPRSATRSKTRRRMEPEPRRRVPLRTFADWNEPLPGSMEMDLVAHCGEVNRGSYINSLVLTDVASGWTEAAPLVVRESNLVVETLERIRVGLPFVLRALDVDNGSEFVNDNLIEYCLSRGIELTRSRPYRKNDQAWIEQKNGAVVRKLLGYRRFEGIAAAKAITRLYGASQRCQEVLALDRLLDEIVGPATQGQHGEVVVTVPGDQQRRRLRAKCSDLSEQSEPVHPRHLDVGNDGVVVRGVDLTEGARRRIAGVDGDSLHPQLESLGKRLQQDDVVVHDQDTRHAHPAGCSDGSAVARGSSRTKVAPSAPSPFPNAIEPPYSLTMP